MHCMYTCLSDGKLSESYAYYFQLQTQMFVCSVTHGDFVITTTCVVARYLSKVSLIDGRDPYMLKWDHFSEDPAILPPLR